LGAPGRDHVGDRRGRAVAGGGGLRKVNLHSAAWQFPQGLLN
jgi:hypothetical protein